MAAVVLLMCLQCGASEQQYTQYLLYGCFNLPPGELQAFFVFQSKTVSQPIRYMLDVQSAAVSVTDKLDLKHLQTAVRPTSPPDPVS